MESGHDINRAAPLLRGLSHLAAFPLSLLAGIGVALAADGTRQSLGVVLYAASVSSVLGVSAMYHRVRWNPSWAPWVRRLDHAMIFLAMAGTYTAFWVLVLDSALANWLLAYVWVGAMLGVVMKLLWIDVRRWLGGMVYIGFGLAGFLVVPQLLGAIGGASTAMLLGSAALLLLGSATYTTGRPNPFPNVFGFHEVFHMLTVLGMGMQYFVVARLVLSP